MSYRILTSVLAIVTSVVTSLGCCCPARFAAPIAMRPPVVVVPQPQVPFEAPGVAVPEPNVAPPNLPHAKLTKEAQQFITQNLGPNNRVGSLAANNPFWGTLRQRVANRQYSGQAAPGMGFGKVPFADVYPEGGVLIGFFAGDDGKGHVGFLQPIYLTAGGEKTGFAYGAVRSPLRCLKAKSGYAVSGVNVRVGGVLDAFSAVFAKVEGEALNGADQYASPLVGGQGGGPMAASTTKLVVGIHGQRIEQEAFAPIGSITTLGLVTVP